MGRGSHRDTASPDRKNDARSSSQEAGVATIGHGALADERPDGADQRRRRSSPNPASISPASVVGSGIVVNSQP
jgi:hypothetical protein